MDMADMADMDIVNITNEDTPSNKNIVFNGTSTRYQMKKLLGRVKKEERVKPSNCVIPENYYTYETQLNILNNITKYTDLEKGILNEISKKVSGYKQQDQKNKNKTSKKSTEIKKDVEIKKNVGVHIDIDMHMDKITYDNSFVTIEYCIEQLKKQQLQTKHRKTINKTKNQPRKPLNTFARATVQPAQAHL
jgi:hypothetical protein